MKSGLLFLRLWNLPTAPYVTFNPRLNCRIGTTFQRRLRRSEIGQSDHSTSERSFRNRRVDGGRKWILNAKITSSVFRKNEHIFLRIWVQKRTTTPSYFGNVMPIFQSFFLPHHNLLQREVHVGNVPIIPEFPLLLALFTSPNVTPSVPRSF